jgi:transcriptional regulator with XRE-family HTH domain
MQCSPRFEPQRLRTALAVRGRSQAWLARHLDLSRATVNQWAQGVRRPALDQLPRICQALDVSADYLLALAPDIQLPAAPT